MNSVKNIAPTLCLASLYFASSQAIALGRCAMEDGGSSGVPIFVPGLSASDVKNNAAGAWTKIAEAAGVVGPVTQTGYINLTIYTTVYGIRTAIPGSFPMYFGGQQSLTAEIMRERGLPLPGGRDPRPCDPEKNSCCDECSNNAWAVLDPILDVMNGGFFTRQVVAENSRGRRVRFARATMKFMA